MNERGFMITSTVVKRHWWTEDEIEITITDGKHTIKFMNHGTFTVDTDKPLIDQLLFKDT